MRTSSICRNHQKDIWKLIVAAIFCAAFLTVSACAKQGGTNFGKKLPSKKPAKVETKAGDEKGPVPQIERETIKKEPKSLPTQTSPKGKASANLVEEGRKFLADNKAAEAQGAFQQAITVDPNNGFAYYYLARAEFELGEYQKADGVLDKAEELLEGSTEWLEAISTLRDMIGDKLAEKL